VVALSIEAPGDLNKIGAMFRCIDEYRTGLAADTHHCERQFKQRQQQQQQKLWLKEFGCSAYGSGQNLGECICLESLQ
jgi:hypothetical protein